MEFKSIWILLFIPIVWGALIYGRRKSHPAALNFPSIKLFASMTPTWRSRFVALPFVMRLVVLALFIIALAQPRSVSQETIHRTEGVDIVLAIDSSGSMLAEDFEINKKRVNRLEIVKNVVDGFIDERTSDRIGIISFAGLAYTVCPLTSDYTWLKENLSRIEIGQIKDGTAVGSAIVAAVSRLKQSNAKSKVIILLTDGVNNAGNIDPISAARTAEAFGIKIYTIGAGTKGYVPYPAQDFFGKKVYQKVLIELDEVTLKKVASITNGLYFRATDAQNLREVYKEIDDLEKTEIEQFGYLEYEEFFVKYLLLALVLLVVEIILSNTVFLRIP